MSPGGGPDRAEPNGVGIDRFRDAQRPRGLAPIAVVRRTASWRGPGLAEEPRIRSRTALVPQVQQKRPVRVGKLRSAQTINVILRRDPVKLEPLQLAPET